MTLRQCPGPCGSRFIPEGKESLCPDCEVLTVFPRVCQECGGDFKSDDLFAAHGNWCASRIYEQSRHLYE